jgi:DNA repair exonuclease SbcCD ATPase subunit
LSAAVREWAANDAKDRVVAALQIEARTAALAGNLQAADARLDASAMAMGDIRRLLDLAQSLGGQVDPTSTDQVLELIAALRGQLNEAEQAVEEVRRFANPDGGTIEQRVAQIAKLLARVVLTLSEFEARLDEFATRLTEIRGEARQLQEQTSNYILLGAIVCYALLAWIAAGQAALCWWGVMRCRRRTAAIL